MILQLQGRICGPAGHHQPVGHALLCPRRPRGVARPRQLGVHAFRDSDSSMPSSSSCSARLVTTKDTADPTNPSSTPAVTPPPADEPLSRKPSFPFVVAIAFFSLPFDLAAGSRRSNAPRHSHQGHSKTSSSPPASPPRHGKAPADCQIASQFAASATPSADRVAATKQEAAAAAAAVGPGGGVPQRPRLKPSKAAAAAGDVVQAVNTARAAAEAAQGAATSSSQASEAAARLRGSANSSHSSATSSSPANTANSSSSTQGPPGAASSAQRAAQQPVSPTDSWDTSDLASDEEAEQLAKAMVIELITHPKDTEAALLRAAAADADGSGGRMSVSPDYIDALVQAVREPSLGMPHSSAPAADGNSSSSGGGGASAAELGTALSPGVEDPTNTAPPSTTAAPAANDGAPAAGADKPPQQPTGQQQNGPRRRSIWSWLETTSPQSSQDEF